MIEINILLPIWGKKYITGFLQYGLPSLLAPGNIPALTMAYKTRFTFLTATYYSTAIHEHPLVQKLKALCDVEFLPIDDLIGISNYSTTVTLAYDKAIKKTGAAMLHTYFLFLTSDYLMADGSLLNGVLKYIEQGYSGICAGNFQVDANKFKLFLDEYKDTADVIAIKPRALLEKAFDSLHAITISSTLNQTGIHQYEVNRFFYQANKNTLVGRFYLLHMLCIKPETMNYTIGSSCDYAFIPEMCPSGHITIIDDSDDYLVVEMQAPETGTYAINLGPYDLDKLTIALAEWTTKEHRHNANTSIYYHLHDLTESNKKNIEKNLNNLLTPIQHRLGLFPIQPHRNHPYWIGAIKIFHQQQQWLKTNRLYECFDDTTPKFSIFHSIFGKPPMVYPWHFRWFEYVEMQKILKSMINSSNNEEVFILYDSYHANQAPYYHYLKNQLNVSRHYHLNLLIEFEDKFLELGQIKFKHCIFFIQVKNVMNYSHLLKKINPLLKADGKLTLILINPYNHYSDILFNFIKELTSRIQGIYNAGYAITHQTCINNNLTSQGAWFIAHLKEKLKRKELIFLTYCLLCVPVSIYSLVRNALLPILGGNKKQKHCAAIVLNLSSNKIDEYN